MYSDTWDAPSENGMTKSGVAIILEITLRRSISVNYERISMGFDVPTPARRHLTLYNVISATGGNTKISLICHRIVMTIINQNMRYSMQATSAQILQ